MLKNMKICNGKQIKKVFLLTFLVTTIFFANAQSRQDYMTGLSMYLKGQYSSAINYLDKYEPYATVSEKADIAYIKGICEYYLYNYEKSETLLDTAYSVFMNAKKLDYSFLEVTTLLRYKALCLQRIGNEEEEKETLYILAQAHNNRWAQRRIEERGY